MSRIFYNYQVMPLSYAHHNIHVGSNTCIMCYNNCLCSDCYQLFNFAFIYTGMIGSGIAKSNFSTTEYKWIYC